MDILRLLDQSNWIRFPHHKHDNDYRLIENTEITLKEVIEIIRMRFVNK